MSSLRIARLTDLAAVVTVAVAGLLVGASAAAAAGMVAAVLMALGLVARSFPLVGTAQAVVVGTAAVGSLIGSPPGLVALLAAGSLGFAAGELARLSINLRRRPDPARLGRGVAKAILRDGLLVGAFGIGASIAAAVLAGGSVVASWLLPLGLLALGGLVALLRFGVPLPPSRR